MAEDILFNPGDAIAQNYDYNAVMRSAEIFHYQQHPQQFVLVQAPEDACYAVFRIADAAHIKEQLAPLRRYQIVKRL
ncbi:hypothetical protein IV38_GL001199 [Lactobacillus selangorensis]|uniref:Uncharacterized protein n=1 Tax=Lactobacillus selangorensis TaxID=81857 RepID=A0A0R2FUS0_9LACO|nr:hypothetical protein [Lactobacillus selangorensis]KRN28986.1 hypothetical protein IV38_GL001199 [Lactobacillus selangorensis]KRN32604.1 hypothetical protein IV40_GL000654 [Lactobacillus selangorensis]